MMNINKFFYFFLIFSVSLQLSGQTRETITDSVILKPLTLPAKGKKGELRVDGADEKLKKWSSTANAWQGITGGGGGSVNFITNGDSEGALTGFNTYADAAGTKPVDGTGGTSSITITQSSTAPLFGAKSFIITKPASNVQGHGASVDFTIESGNQAKALQIAIDYTTTGTFQAGSSSQDSDLTVWIYDITNATLIQPSSYKFFSNSATIADKFIASFQSASNSTNYRLIFHQGTPNNAAFTMKCEMSVSTSNYVQGTIRGPVGSIISTGSITPPQGYLYADGSAVSRVQYAELFKAIGTTYGVGDGTTTFNLPNGKGVFLRGAGSQTIGGIGYTGTIGTTQGDQLQGHIHAVKTNSNNTGTGTSGTNMAAAAWNGAVWTSGTGFGTQPPFDDGTNGNVRYGAETRPASIVVAYHICFDSGSVQMSDGYEGRVIATKVVGGASTSVPTGGAPTTLPMGTVSIDKTASYNGTNTITLRGSGAYLVLASVNSNAASGTKTTYVYKNGLDQGNLSTGGIGAYTGMSGAVLVDGLDGETITLVGRNFSGTTETWNVNQVVVYKLSGSSTMSPTSSVALRVGRNATQTLSSTSYTGNKVSFAYVNDDTHGAWNPSTNEWTVPAPGRFSFSYIGLVYGTLDSEEVDANILLDGTPIGPTNFTFANMGNAPVHYNAHDIVLKAGQKIWVSLSFSGSSARSLHQQGQLSIVRTGL